MHFQPPPWTTWIHTCPELSSEPADPSHNNRHFIDSGRVKSFVCVLLDSIAYDFDSVAVELKEVTLRGVGIPDDGERGLWHGLLGHRVEWHGTCKDMTDTMFDAEIN